MACFFQVLFKMLMTIFVLFSSSRMLGVWNIADVALLVLCKTQECFHLFVEFRVALILAFGLEWNIGSGDNKPEIVGPGLLTGSSCRSDCRQLSVFHLRLQLTQ